jgi:uncharacterized protein (TIGR02145 family)
MKEIKIGDQIWSAENLNVNTFQNGDLIPQAVNINDWINSGLKMEPCWCYYQNDVAKGRKFGKLYNWFAVNDSRKLAPYGWEIPTGQDFTQLALFLEDKEFNGIKLKNYDFIKDNKKWARHVGFCTIPGPMVDNYFEFYERFAYGCWWSLDESSKKNFSYAYHQILNSDFDCFESNYIEKSYGLPIRCMKK